MPLIFALQSIFIISFNEDEVYLVKMIMMIAYYLVKMMMTFIISLNEQ